MDTTANPSGQKYSLEAFEGCILGLAIGDALGFPAEFRSRREILDSFGPAGLTDFVGILDPRWKEGRVIVGTNHPPGTYTDDTQMSIAVAEGLLDAGGSDLDRLMEAIGRRFVSWSRSAENNRAPGSTCMAGCDRLASGISWRNAGIRGSKGCGACMRVAPIGLAFAHDRERLVEVARASSLLTHGHPAALDSAAAAALLVAMALDRWSPERMYAELLARCSDRELVSRLKKLRSLLHADLAIALSRQGLGEAWVADEAVASALYCFWRSPDDYTATVLAAANTDGDSDSIACIAGSISGAYLGVQAIPQTWREGVENSAYLRDLAHRLWRRGV